MDNIIITRMNHLGVVAAVIKDIKLVEIIDSCMPQDVQEQKCITYGEAFAGMILNSLGCIDRPLSLTPSYFEHIPIDQLINKDAIHDHFNCHTLGSALDAMHSFGCENLFYLVASAACQHENIDTRFVSLDTSSIILTGEYDECCDEETVFIMNGYSKDHHPELKQFVQELMISQDGGVPIMVKCWDGNASDNILSEERTKQIMAEFEKHEAPRYLMACSKLYDKNNMQYLSQRLFIIRIPGSVKQENTVIDISLESNNWIEVDAQNRYQSHEVIDNNVAQRWIVVHSDQERERANKILTKAIAKEKLMLENTLHHLSQQGYACQHDAEISVLKEMKKAKYHQIESIEYTTQKDGTSNDTPGQSGRVKHYILVDYKRNDAIIEKILAQRSCYVIATNVSTSELSDLEVIAAYKRQYVSVENKGFRFLKKPGFFVNSLYLEKKSRTIGLVIMMNMALLVYSIAQRRLRKTLTETNQTLPNQIKQPIKNVTMQWIFDLMNGIYVLDFDENGKNINIVNGLSDLKKKIIRLLGKTTMEIYRID